MAFWIKTNAILYFPDEQRKEVNDNLKALERSSEILAKIKDLTSKPEYLDDNNILFMRERIQQYRLGNKARS